MNEPADKARALLDIALETYDQEIRPALPKEKRYAGAMIANALGIAKRRLAQPDPAEALLDATQAKDLAALARAIRAGDVSGASQPGIAHVLLGYLEAELAITNPAFLDRRRRG